MLLPAEPGSRFARRKKDLPNEELVQAERYDVGKEAAGVLLQQTMQPGDTVNNSAKEPEAFLVDELQVLYDLPSAEK